MTGIYPQRINNNIYTSLLQIPLQVVSPLDRELLKGWQLGLHGEHQYLNAGLATSLSRTWLQKTRHAEGFTLNDTVSMIALYV